MTLSNIGKIIHRKLYYKCFIRLSLLLLFSYLFYVKLLSNNFNVIFVFSNSFLLWLCALLWVESYSVRALHFTCFYFILFRSVRFGSVLIKALHVQSITTMVFSTFVLFITEQMWYYIFIRWKIPMQGESSYSVKTSWFVPFHHSQFM